MESRRLQPKERSMSEDTLRIIMLIAVGLQVAGLFVPYDLFKRKGKGSGDHDSSKTTDIVKNVNN
tara:strand:- start:298 stop:492 length:195 start_codon:yes stop_codon:yes gene_type:complete